jgi:molybdopterin-guanine dinucleotide biosynthesis protein A
MSDIPVNGLILAGGKSTRMGQDKALLDRGGQSQLAYLAGLLDKKVERVFVSTRADQKDDGERCKYAQIVDRYDDMGPLAGILSAMEEHPDSDWLVVACDLPNITGETITHLLKNCSADHPFTAYVSSHDGLPEPLCAIYRAGSIAIMRRFADEGIYCPRKILIRSDTFLLEQSDPGSLDNINTPDDLADSILKAVS